MECAMQNQLFVLKCKTILKTELRVAGLQGPLKRTRTTKPTTTFRWNLHDFDSGHWKLQVQNYKANQDFTLKQYR